MSEGRAKTVAAVVVAAGQGLRAGQPLPKQFAPWRGKPVVRHSIEALVAAGISPVVVVIAQGAEEAAGTALSGLPVNIVTGGSCRRLSVRNGLEALAGHAPDSVLIHDAARPGLTSGVIKRLIDALEEHPGAIPVLPVADSLAHADGGLMGAPARREDLRRIQTPQAFRFADILAAHRAWKSAEEPGDDARVAQANGLAVALVEGDEKLHKLTYAHDFASDRPAVRIGSGHDVHRLEAGRELWLCGIRLDHDQGLAGHSDADVALHALVDALLGAIGEGDIGQHFPPSDPQWRGASSDRFVTHALGLVAASGYAIGNVDLTIVCERPKIGPHREAMRDRLAGMLGVGRGAVSVKATTTEGLGPTGRGEGIEAHTVVTVIRCD